MGQNRAREVEKEFPFLFSRVAHTRTHLRFRKPFRVRQTPNETRFLSSAQRRLLLNEAAMRVSKKRESVFSVESFVRRVKKQPVRVFYSLLILCLLEVLLWSFVLVPGDANSVWNQSAQQYYQRETGNLKSFQQQPRFQVPVSVLDIRLETLAWRKEEFNLYDKKFAPALGEPLNTSSLRKKCGAN